MVVEAAAELETPLPATIFVYPTNVGPLPELRDTAAAGERARTTLARTTEVKKAVLLSLENSVPQVLFSFQFLCTFFAFFMYFI